MIIQALTEIQDRCGYLPVDELRKASDKLKTPLHRLHEVASFYPLYRLQPPPLVDVRVCRDMSCHLRGSQRLRENLQALANELGKDEHGKDRMCVQGVSCLGQCDSAPAVVSINDHVYFGISDQEIQARVQAAAAQEPLPHQQADCASLGWKIDPYGGKPEYNVLRRVLKERNSDWLLKAMEVANLRGMGGAGFPTARKWTAVKGAPGNVKYVVCNADESEPGTFKDRELLRRTPHLVLEGMLLAGIVTGATRGYVYLRHEYHQEKEVLQKAIDKARAEKLCGDNILDSDLSMSLEIYVSPGGYVQGEESALLEAMEDRRGEPRNKPPFPVNYGLFNKPTVINNVETLSWVPGIAIHGGEWYRDRGVNGATGMRFVSISGDVNRPGVYEVPFGQTVRDLVFTTAGGVRGGQKLKAIAPSGPSGGFLPAFIPKEKLPEAFAKSKVPAGAPGLDILDLTLDLGTLAAIGSMLGAAFVVYGDRADMVEQALNCTEFFRNESCGKCVPCRMGSQKTVDLIGELRQGKLARTSLDLFNELGQTMTITSICGLGMVAANPMMSVVKYFENDVEKYLRGK
jgi:NADH:ubiquinone oxidoreductase subunit F (NADH-binding)/NADH:ubiquinone oxidoreductase subunit E